ncbi:Restriction enzyme BgcI subunit beta [Moraxella ovis]|nr:Restriction enzyme BgcI subunit beta [Moraxella ovis]
MMMNKLKLTDREWKGFAIEKFFNIYTGKDLILSKIEQGHIPIVSHSEINNGIQAFSKKMQNYIMFNSNTTISLADRGTFKSFVQPSNFYIGTRVKALEIKIKISKNTLKFITTCIDRQSILFSYGRNACQRLNKLNILLPTDNSGNPDWQFMEDYIKQIEQKQKSDLINYYSNKLLEIISDTNHQDVQWGCFEIGKIFNFINKPSKGLTHLPLSERGTNYIGATNRNNGVLEYVENNEKLTYDGNAIVFIRNGEGAMGYSVYKKEKFIATQDVSVGYNANLTEYSGLFITTIADKIRGKYNFGYKRNQSRLNKEILRLPIDKNGNPNWQFMEDFIKNIEKDKIKNLLSYLNQCNTLAEPSRAEPSRAEPSRAEPSRAEPSRAEPSRAEPSRAEPSRAEPSRAEPSRAEPR